MYLRRIIAVLATSCAIMTGIEIGYANASTSVWDRLAQCESSGRWHINTGNGYYGGLQFSHRTWKAFGGPTTNAHQASKAIQIAVAKRTLANQGWGAWPTCSRKIGVR